MPINVMTWRGEGWTMLWGGVLATDPFQLSFGHPIMTLDTLNCLNFTIEMIETGHPTIS